MLLRKFFIRLILSFCFATPFIFLPSGYAPVLLASQQPEDVFARGVQAYNAKDYAKAEKLLASYLQDNPGSLIRDIALLWYGRSLIGLNRFSDAENVAATLEKEFPRSSITRQLREELNWALRKKKLAETQQAALGKPKAKPETPSVTPKPPSKAAPAGKEISKRGETKPEAAKPSLPKETKKTAGIATAPPQPKQTAEQKKEKPIPLAAKPAAKPPTAREPKMKTEAAAKPKSAAASKETKPKEQAQVVKPPVPAAEKPSAPTVKKPKPVETAQQQKKPAPPAVKKAPPIQTAPPSERAAKPVTPKAPQVQKEKPPTAVAAKKPPLQPPAPIKTERAAKKPVEKVVSGRDQAAAALLAKAQQAATEKKDQEAVRYLSELLARYPQSAEARMAQSQLVSLLGSPALSEKAIRDYKESLKKGREPRAAAETRRDPFRPLVVRSSDELPINLPMGKRGLLVLRLLLKGIVRTEHASIAVVESGASSAAIFLREKDSIYDGVVEKIYPDRVVFTRYATDKLGKPYQEQVTKRLSGGAAF